MTQKDQFRMTVQNHLADKNKIFAHIVEQLEKGESAAPQEKKRFSAKLIVSLAGVAVLIGGTCAAGIPYLLSQKANRDVVVGLAGSLRAESRLSPSAAQVSSGAGAVPQSSPRTESTGVSASLKYAGPGNPAVSVSAQTGSAGRAGTPASSSGIKAPPIIGTQNAETDISTRRGYSTDGIPDSDCAGDPSAPASRTVSLEGKTETAAYLSTKDYSKTDLQRGSDGYDKYDIYKDSGGNMFYFLHSGNLLCSVIKRFAYQSVPQEKAVPEAQAQKTAETFASAEMGNISGYTFKSSSYESGSGYYSVLYVKKLAGYDTYDTLNVLVGADGEPLAFSALNRGRYDKYAGVKIDSAKIKAALDAAASKMGACKYDVDEARIGIGSDGKLTLFATINATIPTGGNTAVAHTTLTIPIG